MARNDACTSHPLRSSRRDFLAGSTGAALTTTLTGCGFFTSGAADTGSAVSFWDMPWAGPEYSTLARQIVEGYVPGNGNLPASFQAIQWNGFMQTFTAAVASGTNPSASSGGAFQAFQFAEDGAIHLADGLIDRLRADGLLEDFLPGLVDGMKTERGYIAVPWNLDVRPFWYRSSLLDKAGAAPPTTWDEWRDAAAALQKIGSYGFSIGAGSGNNSGAHVLISLMINNGGGLFTENGEPDALFDRNLEAMEFVREFVAKGYIDRGAVGYTSDNQRNQWLAGTYALGFDGSTLTDGMGEAIDDFEVGDLVHGPHGDTGTLQFINNLMMYNDSPSTKSTEAFLQHYLHEIHRYWDDGAVGSLPVLTSITESDAVQGNRLAARMLDVWQPVAKQYGERSPTPFAALARIDGGVAITRFVQTMLAEVGDAKSALTALQSGLETAAE